MDTLAKKDSCSSYKKFIRFQNANTRHDLVSPLRPKYKRLTLTTALNIELLTCFSKTQANMEAQKKCGGPARPSTS
jgi:hypothetical protein